MKIRFTPQAQKKPEHIRGVRVPYAEGKRKIPLFAQWRWYLIVLIVSSPLFYLLGKIVFSYIFITAPGFLSLDKLTINSSSAGIIDQFAVPVGGEVAKGEVIAELSNQDLEERRKIIEAELAALLEQQRYQQDLQKKSGVCFHNKQGIAKKEYQLQLTTAISQQRLAEEMLTYQKNHLDKVSFLQSQGAAPIAELRQAETGYNSALYTVASAKQGVKELQLRIALEKEKEHEAAKNLEKGKDDLPLSPKIQKLNAELIAIADRKKRLIQKAPSSGRILEHLAKEGQAVAPGAPLMLLARQDQPSIICYLQPKYSRYAKAGRRASVRFADGNAVQAEVVEDAKLVKRLPADLAAPIGTRDLLLLVELVPLENLSADLRVDGLPVMVRFQHRLRSFF